MIHASIERPVAVTMVYLALGTLGLVSGLRVPVELLPAVEYPRLRVTATWPGVSAEATEALLTSPIEATTQQVRGVRGVSSTSEEIGGAGRAVVDVEFSHGADMEFARLDLSERLAALHGHLPEGSEIPRVQPYVPPEFASQSLPFLRYTITGPYTSESLGEVVDRQIAPRLRQVSGVADVWTYGGRVRVIEVELAPDRALALGITPEAVRKAVFALEESRAVGRIRAGGADRVLTFRNTVLDTEEFRRLPVETEHGRTVLLHEVAEVRDGNGLPERLYRIDGRPAVSFDVVKVPGTNVVLAGDEVKAVIGAISSGLPRGVHLVLDNDEGAAVRSQLANIGVRSLASCAVVFVILLVFLGTVRSAVIAFASVALSVLVVCNLIFVTGLTINIMTLMGLAMGFGLVVDNTVVVIENIYRRIGRGDAPDVAAARGAREMVLPVLAATGTTVIVLVPFVYLQGELRLFYLPLAAVVALTNLASLVVSFTFTPTLATRVLHSTHDRASAVHEAVPAYQRPFGKMVGLSTRRPWLFVSMTAAALVGSGYLFNEHVTRGAIWRPWFEGEANLTIELEFPRGEQLARADEVVRLLEGELEKIPAVERFSAQVTPEAARITAVFAASTAGTAIPLDVRDRMEAIARRIGGIDVRVYGSGVPFASGGQAPPTYRVQVLGYNYERVREIAEDLGGRLRSFTRVHEVDTNASGNWSKRDKATEVVLRLDRERLAAHSLTSRAVVDHVSATLGNAVAPGELTVGGEQVASVVRLAGHDRVDVRSLENSLIPAPGGAPVRLADVVRIEAREVMGRIVRSDQQYQRMVTYEFRGPEKLGDRVHKSVISSMQLPPGYSVSGQQSWKWNESDQTQMAGVLALSLVLVFMITAALFESVRLPFCVLLTVPLALIGVFLVFLVTGATFTREALIGVIMMGGVVVNNAILLVDRIARIRCTERVSPREAAMRGTLERVRPILMTSAVTILGLLPLVLFSPNPDANIWNAMGYSLLGGLASSTVLVLVVTPALYTLIEAGD
jgi:HAE1 family hydrophobic/amphiphilic exporter-1